MLRKTAAGRVAAELTFKQFSSRGTINGYYKKIWESSSSFILTICINLFMKDKLLKPFQLRLLLELQIRVKPILRPAEEVLMVFGFSGSSRRRPPLRALV
jgi:hypothetical protein